MRRNSPWPSFDHLLAALGGLICLLFFFTLRDAGPSRWSPPPMVAAAPLAPPGDAACDVHVVDSEGRPLGGAVVRVFTLDVSGQVFFAGEKWTRGAEALAFEGLPRGEAWIVAYGAQKSRAATRLLLAEDRRSVTLALRPAHALSVRVIDDAGSPVAEASVSVRTSDPLPHVMLTGADGKLTFNRLGPPPWGVEVEASGYDRVARSGVYPDAAPLEIKVERLGGFEVSVVDADGAAVPLAEVLVSGPGLWPARSATTDEHGRVSILGLYAGLYNLKARADDRISATDMSVKLAHGKTVARTLTVVEGRYIVVTVTDGPTRADALDPPPIEGAAVVLVEEGLSSFPLEERTNKFGVALIGPVSEGKVTVSARAEGFVPRVVGGDALDDDQVSIPLLKGGAIVGDVRDARGFPVDGATVEVFGSDLDGMPIHESSDRSNFRDDLFEFALAGPVPLIARGELGVMPGPVPDIPHAHGSAFDADPRPGGDPWVTRSDGSFRAAPVTPGRVQVLVRHPEYTESISDVLLLASGQELEIHIVLRKGGRLEGRVIEEDRLAVAGARLEIAALEGTFNHITYTTDDGSFAVASVPSPVLISVYRPESSGEIAARLELEIDPEKRTTIEITLPKARDSSTLRFVDDAGFPVSRVEVRVVSLDLATVLMRTLFTGDDGAVEVPGARGLPLRVVAERPGKAPLVQWLAEAEKDHRFVLAPALVLRGFVTGKQGRVKVEDAFLTLYTLAGARHARTDEQGMFEVDDLAAGRIRLVTRHAGFAQDERVVAFDGDPRRTIELERIDLVPAGSVEGVVVDDANGPVAGARVGLDAVPTYLPIGRLPHGVVQTDADGRFQLAELPTGLVELEAYSPELGRGRATGIEIREDRVTRRVTITIPAQDYAPRKIRSAGSLAVTLSERSGGLVVVDVPEGGEAELAGIEPADRILRIAGKSVRTLEDARDGLSGPLSEDVIVELSRQMPQGDALALTLRIRREPVRR